MRRIAFIVPLLLLAACGTTGLGDLGGILGSPSTSQSSDIRGVVDYVDTRAQRIDLDVNYINNLQETRQNQTIYYDSRTRVEYRGRADYRVEQLERGDEISVRGVNDNGRYVAETITVTRSVSG